MASTTSSEQTNDSTSEKMSLSSAEWRTLRSFRRQYKTRYFSRGVLVVLLLYCLSVGAASAYYAFELFTGAKDINQKIDMPTGTSSIEQQLQPLKPIFEKVDFFQIGWTAVLHTVLLLYIAMRAFLRLRRWHVQTPKAKLAMKLAKRLEELGQLDLSKL